MKIETARKRRYKITQDVTTGNGNYHGHILGGKNCEIDRLNKIIGEHAFINHPYHAKNN